MKQRHNDREAALMIVSLFYAQFFIQLGAKLLQGIPGTNSQTETVTTQMLNSHTCGILCVHKASHDHTLCHTCAWLIFVFVL